MRNLPLVPLCFGPPHRRLFGIYHPSSAVDAQRPGIVICNPLGQEAIRAQRLLRILAERLASAGHPVLRFDAFGMGDSMGEETDLDLAGWSDDLLLADRTLRSHSGAVRSAWLGMRLGAIAALRAADRAPPGLVRLLAWDPPIDGARYLDHLRERHVANLDDAFSLPAMPSFAQQALDPAAFRDEALGIALSAKLREQLAALSPATLRVPAAPASICVLTDPDYPGADAVDAWCARQPGRIELTLVRHGTDWTSDSADNTSLVPAAALGALVDCMTAAA